MKICFVTTVSITLRTFVLKLAEFLHKTGRFDISFICNPDKDFEKMLPNYIHYYPVKMGRGINLDGLSAIREMTKIFKDNNFDLVQYSTPNASCYASIAAKLAKVPVRLYCQWGILYVAFSGVKRFIFKSIEKLVCSLSTRIEPDSNSNLEFSIDEKLYKRDKAAVVWNGSASGVDFEKFDISKKDKYREEIRTSFNIPMDAFVYGFVGRITRDKGINELFSAMKKVLEDNRNAYLLLVGSVEDENLLNPQLFAWAKANPKIIFCGYTNVVEQYISAMDCYILPSYREGFGLGVVEAEAMGVPVIVSDIPGPTDAMINGKTGFIVIKKDVDSLYTAMTKVMLPQEELEAIRSNAVAFAKNFEQKQLFKHILDDRNKLLELKK